MRSLLARAAVPPLALLTACAWAPPPATGMAAPTRRTACAINGWSADSDPKGLNVRADPRADARVLGVLPPARVEEPGGPRLPVVFEITASENGWLRIRNASDESSAQRPVFAGEGWVSGRQVGFQVQSSKAFSRPDAASPVALALGKPMEDLASVERVVACSGEWALIDGRYRPAAQQALEPGERPRTGRFRGWVRGVCANPVTTCDGVVGD